ncbi:MAG: tRNA dihydrouridine synthase DusB [Oscillospiraceae bacterium]|nr:tRNA dihydrouridine synthase DusB [Oscillospiraceae bacterium]
MEYIRIGNSKIEKTAALAPMASVADRAYRLMAKEFGAAYCVAEMASVKGLCYSDKKTAELLCLSEGERPAAVQLFGAEPEFFARAVKIAEEYKPDIIDINAGCPMPKIVNGGAGAALMKTPRLLGEIVRAAAEATDIPITVKFRSGWDENTINAVEIAKIAEENGAAAVTVHSRTKNQLYTGKADRSVIKAVKEAVNIPVIASGDVVSVEDCVEMYEQTGCDLVMIGRGSYGRPWLFGQIRDHFEGKQVRKEPDIDEKLDIMRRHISLLVEDKGEYVGIKEARRQAAWYIKGISGAAKLRDDFSRMNTLDDFERLTEKIRESGQNGLN